MIPPSRNSLIEMRKGGRRSKVTFSISRGTLPCGEFAFECWQPSDEEIQGVDDRPHLLFR